MENKVNTTITFPKGVIPVETPKFIGYYEVQGSWKQKMYHDQVSLPVYEWQDDLFRILASTAPGGEVIVEWRAPQVPRSLLPKSTGMEGVQPASQAMVAVERIVVIEAGGRRTTQSTRSSTLLGVGAVDTADAGEPKERKGKKRASKASTSIKSGKATPLLEQPRTPLDERIPLLEFFKDEEQYCKGKVALPANGEDSMARSASPDFLACPIKNLLRMKAKARNSNKLKGVLIGDFDAINGGNLSVGLYPGPYSARAANAMTSPYLR